MLFFTFFAFYYWSLDIHGICASSEESAPAVCTTQVLILPSSNVSLILMALQLTPVDQKTFLTLFPLVSSFEECGSHLVCYKCGFEQA